jgi:large subunit ribosomal protein L4
MKLAVKNIQGQQQEELEVKLPLVEDGRYTQAVHDAVVAHLAGRRLGTACTKTMGEVAGTGKKPWRQKGTGRARAGSYQSPLWVGGGVVFGPKPRDYSLKVNKKTRRLALRKALSERLKAGDVLLVGELKLQSPKTRELVGVLKALELNRTVMIVTAAEDNNLRLASRNLQDVEVANWQHLNAYEVLRPGKLLFTREAFEKLQEHLMEAEAA